MSIGEKGICVRILDKEFQIRCPEKDIPLLTDAAKELDKQLMRIRQTGKVITIERMMMMAALNITHELLTLKQHTAQMQLDFESRIESLQNRIDKALQKEQQ